ncbi:MAG: hypothetical protein U0166_29545 [Acidobacteriota bacterium]
MSRIESIVAGLHFEKDAGSSCQYPVEIVSACEALVGCPFPEDVRWYLVHVGWRKLDFDHRSMLVRNGDYIYELQFEGAEHQAFCESRYASYLENDEGELLPYDARRYFPIGKIEGEINPRVTLRLLVNLNDEDRGSIWGVAPRRSLGDPPSTPIRMAGDLATLLEQIGSTRERHAIATKNNDALFERLLAAYLAKPKVVPTSGEDPAALIRFFHDSRVRTIFDGARNVEYARYASGKRFETAAQVEACARICAVELPKSAAQGSPILRRAVQAGEPVTFDRLFGFDNESYFVVSVGSTIGDGVRLKEEFLLYHDQPTRLWTIVLRLTSEIDEVKVKGIGTFAYDATSRWQLKKKVTPAWSNLKASLHVDGFEDALTERRIDFVRTIIAKAELRPVFEGHVFKLYRERIYPDFEAMPDDEKKDWKKAYPKLDGPRGIWTLFGNRAAIHVEDDTTFSLDVDARFDPEHGLSVRVRDWQIV